VANTLFMPLVTELSVSKRAMATALEAQERGFAVGAVGYDQPTLVWYYHHPAEVLPLWSADQEPRLARLLSGPVQPANANEPAPTFGTQGAPTVVIVSQPVRQALDAAGVHYVLVQHFRGFRTDTLSAPLNAVRGWFGMPPKRQEGFQISVIANAQPFPPPVAMSTTLPWPGISRKPAP
jgi:hypothetical protein